MFLHSLQLMKCVKRTTTRRSSCALHSLARALCVAPWLRQTRRHKASSACGSTFHSLHNCVQVLEISGATQFYRKFTQWRNYAKCMRHSAPLSFRRRQTAPTQFVKRTVIHRNEWWSNKLEAWHQPLSCVFVAILSYLPMVAKMIIHTE